MEVVLSLAVFTELMLIGVLAIIYNKLGNPKLFMIGFSCLTFGVLGILGTVATNTI